MTWKRTKPEKIEKGEEYTLPPSLLVRRDYKSGKGIYPRITITIMVCDGKEFPSLKGVSVCISRKDTKKSWWCDTRLPQELLGELLEMIQEVQVKINETQVTATNTLSQ